MKLTKDISLSDSIVATDVANFPEQNLAEALQRNQRHVAELRERYRDAGIPPEKLPFGPPEHGS